MLRTEMELITKEVKNKISEHEIVLPETYNEIFIEVAKALNISIEDILDLNNVDRTMFHQFEALEENTSAAITAIDKQDLKKLKSIAEEVATLKEEIVNLKEDIYTDALTKTYNRKYLLHKILNDKNNFLKDGVFSIVDLNNLKYINDNIGHNIGDKVIILLSNELRKLCKEVVRYGGDEFLLFFENETQVKNVDLILNNLRDALLKKRVKTKSENFRVSFSFASIKYSKNEWFEPILEEVDKKMYIDKVAIKEKIQ